MCNSICHLFKSSYNLSSNSNCSSSSSCSCSTTTTMIMPTVPTTVNCSSSTISSPPSSASSLIVDLNNSSNGGGCIKQHSTSSSTPSSTSSSPPNLNGVPMANCNNNNNHSPIPASVPIVGGCSGASPIGINCAGCGSLILDRYYLSAVDRHWHISCLKCSQCKIDLQSEPSCFSRDGLIFCKADYYRLFTMRRCSRCGEGIYASELVMRVRDQNVYHIQCFTCAWCNVTLSQGDLFGIRDNLVYCRVHYEMLSATASASAASFGPSPNSMLSLGPQPSSTGEHGGHPLHQHHGPQHGHGHHHHHHHNHSSSQNSSPMHDSAISAETCSTMAATPYATGSIYSPLSIGGGGGGGSTTTPIGNSGQSPTTPQSIRKGRPRKRKMNADHSHHQNADSQSTMSMSNNQNNNSQLSPTISSRNSHSPGIGGLDGGPLSGLAASIENSCQLGGNSQLSNSSLSMGSHHSNSRTKRMRTSFKHHQLRTMKTYFSVNQNPDAKDLKQLAQKTGLSKRVLQVWFQNARAKWRRNNLKMMPDGTEMTLNGQTMLNMGHSSTPSTVIGSPDGGSTRPFSSPSPSDIMSPLGGGGDNGSHHSMGGPPPPPQMQQSQQHQHNQHQPGLDLFIRPGDHQSTLLPMNFQELY